MDGLEERKDTLHFRRLVWEGRGRRVEAGRLDSSGGSEGPEEMGARTRCSGGRPSASTVPRKGSSAPLCLASHESVLPSDGTQGCT